MSELVDLWRAWASGPLTASDVELWGRPLWWWPRVAILLQAAGLVGIVFEIIGEERLREMVRSARQGSAFDTALIKLNIEPREDAGPIARAAFPVISAGLAAYWMIPVGFSAFFVVVLAVRFLADVGVLAARPVWIPGLPSEMPLWAALPLFIVAVLILRWSLRAVLMLGFVAVADGFALLLANRKSRMVLNLAILGATVFNLHFTLLIQ